MVKAFTPWGVEVNFYTLWCNGQHCKEYPFFNQSEIWDFFYLRLLKVESLAYVSFYYKSAIWEFFHLRLFLKFIHCHIKLKCSCALKHSALYHECTLLNPVKHICALFQRIVFFFLDINIL